ncbi:uncharacterized protein LOC124361339 [Homalodisca vitripennis]|uniref:uncharacterized protein LOC124361339 n=1 Tax=Homalodisca vitripennis TaxID=197043 RepID=UPI001EEC86E9|nr:uncharacterized protein LOC124361339 [Homalodisca vitripennis]
MVRATLQLRLLLACVLAVACVAWPQTVMAIDLSRLYGHMSAKRNSKCPCPSVCGLATCGTICCCHRPTPSPPPATPSHCTTGPHRNFLFFVLAQTALFPPELLGNCHMYWLI